MIIPDHTFTVNGLDQYLTGAGVTFTYDARGSLTYDGTRTYVYDFDNRLTNVTGVGGAVALSYDPAGRLYQTAQTAATGWAHRWRSTRPRSSLRWRMIWLARLRTRR